MEEFDMVIVGGIAVVLFIQAAFVNWIVKKICKKDSKPQRIIILTIITFIVTVLRVAQYKNSLNYSEMGLTNMIMSFVGAWILCLIVFSSFFKRKKETELPTHKEKEVKEAKEREKENENKHPRVSKTGMSKEETEKEKIVEKMLKKDGE